MVKSISVNAEKCTHCGMCLKDCIVGVLEFDENKIPKFIANGENGCVSCQHCMAICPTGALSFGGVNPENLDKATYANSEELLNLIKSRRSIRHFKKQSVPKEKLDQIASMLPFAPTGGNRDNLHFSIIQTKEKMDEIIKTSYDEIFKMQNPSPEFELAKNAFSNGNDIIYRGASSMIAVAIDKSKTIAGCETADPIIALSYVDLYAQSIGVGTTWCDYALMIANKIPKVYSLLDIPDGYTLDYILLLGLPAVKYKRTIAKPEMFNINFVK
ncbi:MAG: nitroreductase family protein [Campylobacter sp.]|nr:nitroreductase family protein [Campylobacter sp.]